MQRQSGVALITALLVVSLVTVAAVSMASRQQLDIRRTANILQSDQAYVFALGGEVFAKEVLVGDDNPNVDHMDEDWGIYMVFPEFQGGMLEISGEDLQGRFNINNLRRDLGEETDWDAKLFENLIEVLKAEADAPDELKEAYTHDLVKALRDWLDDDSDMRTGGAEDSAYLERERPYRAANRPMVSASELLLVQGFTPTIYKALEPLVTALPTHTEINVNTAKDRVLQAMMKDPSCLDPSQLNRPEGGLPPQLLAGAAGQKKVTRVFDSEDDYLSHDLVARCDFLELPSQLNGVSGASPAAIAASASNDKARVKTMLSVKSEYFLLRAYSEVGAEDRRSRVRLFSVLHRTRDRDKTKVVTILRGQGTY